MFWLIQMRHPKDSKNHWTVIQGPQTDEEAAKEFGVRYPGYWVINQKLMSGIFHDQQNLFRFKNNNYELVIRATNEKGAKEKLMLFLNTRPHLPAHDWNLVQILSLMEEGIYAI